MEITKNTICKTLEELIEVVKKLRKKAKVKTLSFSGSYNNEAKIKSFSVHWTEEEEI